MVSNRRIAIWVPERKYQKIDWEEFEKVAKEYDFEIFKLDLSKNLECQGPFGILLHKLTDIIVDADRGDEECKNIINRVQNYLTEHPSVIVIDPLPNVRNLLNRYITYSIIQSTKLYTYGIFTPSFCELTGTDVTALSSQLQRAKITYPFISKSFLGHGPKTAHQMSIIFNEKGLADCMTPSVAQSFINHNAVLYKLFIVGKKYRYVERPSLKNFSDDSLETITFHSSDVSKAGSQSYLSVLDPNDVVELRRPDKAVFDVIVKTVREAFGMDLLGVDVVIDNSTGKYAIIDVNAYPGYDGYPNFFNALMDCIAAKVDNCSVNDNVGSSIVEYENMNHLQRCTITE